MSRQQEIPLRKSPVHLPNVERYNEPIIVLLTVCTKDRRPALATAAMHVVLRKSWGLARNWNVGRYIIMPDHIHLFCSPAAREAENVKDWTAYWKRLASREFPRLQPLWQRDCWDTQLRHARLYGDKWQYVVANPVRKALVAKPEDWPYQGVLNDFRW